MKFRTEITVEPLPVKIGYENRILSLGSCFADEMARRMEKAKFRVTVNPTGTLFNPCSVARLLHRAASDSMPAKEELHRSAEGLWFHYDFHGSFSDADSVRALDRMKKATTTIAGALGEADRLLITFGTAWIYELRETGEPVANCHKQPQRLFVRRRLGVHEIVAQWSELLETLLADRHTIFTVSPVRHMSDGAAENFLSKAVLRLAVAELIERHPNASYFPAYEILMDDLRDYRFYAEDLVHPSEQAVEYIWEKFAASALDARALSLLPQIEELTAAARHRPLHPHSPAAATFARRMSERAERLETQTGIDFTREKAAFAADRTK